jgi:hypothetical protein
MGSKTTPQRFACLSILSARRVSLRAVSIVAALISAIAQQNWKLPDRQSTVIQINSVSQ